MRSNDKAAGRVDAGCAISFALFSAMLFLPVWIWDWPWYWALLFVAVFTALLYEAKRRWDFDLWEWMPWWLLWWWW
jgi:energy-coupling factor transporter transmembrane protein EcfT